MHTSFQRAIRQFSKRDQDLLEALLQKWSVTPIGATIAPNLRDREHFLPSRFMVRLLAVMKQCAHLPIQEIEIKYQEKCYRMQRKGGEVKVPTGPFMVLGCAIDRELFIEHVVKKSDGRILTRAGAESFIEKLKNGRMLHPKEREILLKPYTTWVTWDESDLTRDPFGFITLYLADEVRSTLGLDERIRGPILLFRYEKPSDLKVHRPTVADAGLFKYFSPPILTHKKHGYTLPWRLTAFIVGGRSMEIQATPRPEGVHQPVDLGSIACTVSEMP